MTQPDWKLEYSTDYSALYTDRTGVYPPELAILEEYQTARGTTRYLVFRTPLERCQIVDGRLTEGHYQPTHPHPAVAYQPWYASDLDSVIDSCDHKDIVADLCSSDPRRLASAIESIAGYHGWDNFDAYPQDLPPSAIANWPDLNGKPEITISQSDDSDSVTLFCNDPEAASDDSDSVTLFCNDPEAAYDAQSVLGSLWEYPGDLTVAYACVADQPDLVAALEAEGYTVDDSEYWPPDPVPASHTTV